MKIVGIALILQDECFMLPRMAVLGAVSKIEFYETFSV